MAGLQGSGKTTTAGKLALRLRSRERKKVMLASLDVTRPAAREQLRLLGEQAGVGVLPEVDHETPGQIAKRALQAAKLQAFDVLILDTAGRISIDEALMAELRDIKKLTEPHEILLVADALTGQDAVNTAESFHNAIGVTGIVLTRLDGDARGGAALSMRHITGCPSNLWVLVKSRMRSRISTQPAWPAALWTWATLSRLWKRQLRPLRRMRPSASPNGWPKASLI